MSAVWTPRPSQAGLLDFAETRERVAWWATMGAGKTSTAIEWARRAWEDRFELEKLLIVAPPIVAAQTWPQELAKWGHGAVLGAPRVLTARDIPTNRTWDVLDGARGPRRLTDWRATRKLLLSYPERVHTVAWHMLPWLVKAMKSASPYTHVIFDEATFASEVSSQQWKAARYLTSKLGCTHILELSGLPAPNGPEKLWAQVYLLDGGMRLGRTLTAFREAWMEPDTMNRRTGVVYRWKLRESRRAAFDALLAEVAISVHVDLGVPWQVVDHRLPVPADAWDAYQELDRDFVREIDGGVIDAVNSAVLVGKLLQAAQGCIYDGARVVRHLHDAKLDTLEEIVESATRGVLLAYPFQHDWPRIKARIPSARRIDEPGAVEKFSRGETKLLCLHPASGAHGIDGLQLGGSTIVWLGMTYNYEHYAQFNARLVRPGQKDTVFIHRLLMAGTLEEYIADTVLPMKQSNDEALRAATQWRGAAP